MGGCQRELIPTPNIYHGSTADALSEVPPALQGNRIELLYVTDRRDALQRRRLEYDWKRAESLTAGACWVDLGRGLQWDELLKISRSAKRPRAVPIEIGTPFELTHFPRRPRLRIDEAGCVSEDAAYDRACQAAQNEFKAEVERRLTQTPAKEALVYVHGFNNTFDDAMATLAQLWHFVGRRGVPIAYTWPAGSGVSFSAYARDRESGEFTVSHLKSLLRMLREIPALRRINILAHSRGTDVLMTALRELALEQTCCTGDTRETLKLGQVVLAAPDLDIEVSKQRLGGERVYFVPPRLTIYTSPTDLALYIADLITIGTLRIGQISPSALDADERAALADMPTVNVITTRVTESDFAGHSYFIYNPAVISDLILLLRDDRPPGAEHGRPLEQPYPNVWVLRDGYPQR